MVDTVDTTVANAVTLMPNQKLKPMPTMDMVDMEDMVDTVDTMAASADLLKLKLPQLHTTEDMVDTVDTMAASADLLNHLHTMDMVDMVDTDMVDITEDKPNTHLPKSIT